MAILDVESSHHRWQRKTRHAHGRAMPPWTRADDSGDHEGHDFITSKRRKLERKIKRDDTPTEHNVKASWISALQKRDLNLPGNSLRETAVNSPSEALKTTASGSTEENGSPEAAPTETKTSASAYESGSDGNSDNDGTDDEGGHVQETTASAPSSSGTIIGVNQNNEMIGDLHNNVHKILLSVGTVVCFILLASVLIIAWKLRKRSDKRRRSFLLHSTNYRKPSRLDKFLSKISFVRNRRPRSNWSTISDSSRHSSRHSRHPYEKHRSITSSPTYSNNNRHHISSQFFGPSKSMGLLNEAGTPRTDFSQSNSTIDTQFIPPGRPVYSSRRAAASKSRTTLEAVSPTSTMFVEDTAVQVRVVSRLAPKEVRLTTMGRPLPLSPKWATHLKRQTGASDLSSISSGFGDGDIIITPENTVATINTRVPIQPSPVATTGSSNSLRSLRGDSSRGFSSRQSSMKSARSPSQRTVTAGPVPSRQSSMRSRRDTVSTVASVESRVRFRTVNSWVNQQSGQVRRQQREQADSDAPPVPMLPPPEPELRYMMPDGEEPRRVDLR